MLSYIFQECRILPHVRHSNKLLGQRVPSPLSSLPPNRRHSHPPPTQRSTRLPTLHPTRASTSQPGLFQVTEGLQLALPASPFSPHSTSPSPGHSLLLPLLQMGPHSSSCCLQTPLITDLIKLTPPHPPVSCHENITSLESLSLASTLN